jgi:hypothetical protein
MMIARVLTANPRLFVDSEDLELRENVTRVFHQAEKHPHPVLEQGAPWEKHPGMTASVIYDGQEGILKAWYLSGFYAEGEEHIQCYATSKDGVAWERPRLGIHDALGSSQNNIVIPASHHEGKDHWETMLKDPMDGDPARRYKAIGWSSLDWDGPMSGIYTATSPDGLRWAHTPEPVFHFHPRPGTDDLGPVGDAQSMMVDTLRGRYVAFLRGGVDRLMSFSTDFERWTPPRPFLRALHEEESLYNNTGFVYGDQYLGFLTHFDKAPRQQTQSLRLITSRDGESWNRVPGDPIVPTGEVGEWDRFQILLTGAPPVRVGGRLHIYYRGTARRHAKNPREYDPAIYGDQDSMTMAIGLATLRLDGFASMNASFDGGALTTCLFRFAGEKLIVNVKSDYGKVLVALLDDGDRPLRGFTTEECVPIQEDGVSVPVAWGTKRLSDLEEPAKIRFTLRNARLYSYRCE